MFDLNLGLEQDIPTSEKMRELSFEKIENSGTSSSSIVNNNNAAGGGGGDDNEFISRSVDHHHHHHHHRPDEEYAFDILRADENNEFITKELFPLTVAGEETTAVMEKQQQQQWLDLSANYGGVPMVEERIVIAAPLTQQRAVVKKSRRGPRSRSSQYRGVTFYRRTGRWESHIWDCGKQVYLGGFDTAHAAARAYDRAAIKFRGLDADINFNVSDYHDDLKQMGNFSKEEFVHLLRRQSTGFARGSSKYRGVTLHKCGRWEARMGQFLGKKAYDKAAIKCNGREAITNFELSTYEGELSTEVDNGGEIHNLDLNLGMAPSVLADDQLGNACQIENYELQCASAGLPGYRGVMKSLSTTMGSKMPHDHQLLTERPLLWNGVNTSIFPTFKGTTALGKGMEVDCSPHWTRPDQQHPYGDSPSPVPLFSTAASSGFANSTTTGQLPYQHSSPSLANMNFAHYYCRS